MAVYSRIMPGLPRVRSYVGLPGSHSRRDTLHRPQAHCSPTMRHLGCMHPLAAASPVNGRRRGDSPLSSRLVRACTDCGFFHRLRGSCHSGPKPCGHQVIILSAACGRVFRLRGGGLESGRAFYPPQCPLNPANEIEEAHRPEIRVFGYALHH